MDNPWIHCISELLGLLPMSDDPWIHCISELLGWLPDWMSDDSWIHCISELLGLLPHWMSDDPWIIHGYIVFPNDWGGHHIGCQMIHGYIVFLSYFVRGRVLSLTTLSSLDYSCIVMVHVICNHPWIVQGWHSSEAQDSAPDKITQEYNVSMTVQR